MTITTDHDVPIPPLRVGDLSEALPRLPRLVTPGEHDASVEGLVAWVRSTRAELLRELTKHGALLFRGFRIGSAADVERVALAIQPDLKNDYLGTSPRNALTRYVFSASELPPHYPIPQHCEMSFLRDAPSMIFFGCLTEPSGLGGETPLTDMRGVYRDLDHDVRARFDAHGIRTIRNYAGPSGGSRLDPWQLKRWNDVFGTTDRATVEQRCTDSGQHFEWTRNGGLRLTTQTAAYRVHPAIGDRVWFNHSQVFHTSSVAAEYLRIAARHGESRYVALAALARTVMAVRRRVSPPDSLAMQCTYGDGREIGDAEMDRVRDAVWRNTVFNRWRRGDVVAVDNLAVGHGRMPFRGPREVVVAWS